MDHTIDNTDNKSVLELGGIRLNEATYGPFVMNTKEEILQAIEDYQNGKWIKLPLNNTHLKLCTSS